MKFIIVLKSLTVSLSSHGTPSDIRMNPKWTIYLPIYLPIHPPILSIYIPTHPPTHIPIYVSINGSTALVDLGRFFSLLIYTQSIGLLGRGISPSQGRYLHTEQHKNRVNPHRHSCFDWDSNPQSQCSRKRRRSCLRPSDHCDRH
jgi:hypothetical protein